MAYKAPKSAAFGGTLGKRYVNKQYGSVKFGQLGVKGANPRAGMSYSVGIDAKGRVVHIYRDGERIVMHTHAAHAAPPHPDSFGGMAAPIDTAVHNQDYTAASQNLAQQLAGAHRTNAAHLDPALAQQHQLALQAALAAMSQHGA